MLVHYDHEEVGADSAQGAGSSMTEDALRRVTRALARSAASAENDKTGANDKTDLDDLDAPRSALPRSLFPRTWRTPCIPTTRTGTNPVTSPGSAPAS